MLYKQFITISLSLFFSLTALGSIKKSIDSTKITFAKKNQSIKRIDTLSLSKHEKELASSLIKELLGDHMSPFRKMLRENENAHVKAYIDKYTNPNFRSHLSKMKGLSSYYFPLFENVFKETDVPLEIKYLAIVESSLNPHAVSRVGATGPWQFMYATAKGYGLRIDNYVDERKDPIEATYAAANYLKEAYAVYGDWLLAIASYNCGRGNVNRAIRNRGKSNPTFWDIQSFLPRETQNYVPAFIAMSHVLGDPKRYFVEANSPNLPEDIDIILINRELSLSSVAQTLGIEASSLYHLNPSYKKRIINGSNAKPSRLIVPKVAKNDYAKLYNFLKVEPPMELIAQNKQNVEIKSVPKQKPSYYITYKVRDGDTLDMIAKQFKGSSVTSLKAMNDLNTNVIKPGMILKINQD